MIKIKDNQELDEMNADFLFEELKTTMKELGAIDITSVELKLEDITRHEELSGYISRILRTRLKRLTK